MARKLSSPLRIAAIPILLVFVAVLETRQFVSVFRLLTLILVFLLFADIASLLRGKWRDLLLVLASLAFGLSVIEATANILRKVKPSIKYEGWIVSRPVIGWGPEHPGRFPGEMWDPKTGDVIYSVDYTIDANLLRQTISTDKGTPIVFFGDSFTFGQGVNDAETLPQQFADLLDRKQRVLNLGFIAYGPQHFLREMETGIFDLLIGTQPRLFLFMTFAGHAERTACKAVWLLRAPRYLIENGRITFKGPCYEGPSLWLLNWLEYMTSYRYIMKLYRQIGHDDFELYVQTLVAAVQLAKEKYGVTTLIPYIRTSDYHFSDAIFIGTGFSDDSIIARLREGGAIVIDVSLVQEKAQGTVISIPRDTHPTPFANRARAIMLVDFIRREMPGILDPAPR